MNKVKDIPLLALESICKQYASFRLKNISFSLNKGDYFILLGDSGAGKTLVLETIAGLVLPDSGAIYLNDKEITREKIHKRKIGIVFQDHAVFPHMNVVDNIAYPLKRDSLRHGEKRRIIEDTTKLLGIEHLLNRRPATLSGGELQRVALARTLVQRPEVLLLDEPLASLDTRLKSDLRNLLRRLNRNSQTIIHVTHDYEEAASLGNQVAVMHQGKLLQYGPPAEVFSDPRSEFVAHFTGVKNFYKAARLGNSNEVLVNGKLWMKISEADQQGDGFILIRSEDIFLSRNPVDTSAVNNYEGVILEIAPTSTGIEIQMDIGVHICALITMDSLNHLELQRGQTCYTHFKASAVKFI